MPVEEMLGTPSVNMKDMPYVTFETKTIEDAVETRRRREPVFKDQHYARITPPGSRDVQLEKLPQWWEKLDTEYRSGRVMGQWIDKWKSDFKKYEQGLEIPLEGTPIRGWKLISGAQQETLIRMNILTVESLAQANAEAIAYIGMGGLELKRRAESWIQQHQDKAPMAIEMAALKGENDVLKATVANLTAKVAELAKQVEAKSKRGKGDE